MIRRGAALCVAIASVFLMAAVDDPAEWLKNPAQEARAKAMFEQIRCVVCQNESVGASDADIAHDVRTLIRQQIAAGSSDAQVKDYLRGRYGDFILLKPRLTARTALLWGAPFGIVLVGGALIARRRWRRQAEPVAVDEDLTAAELKALKQLQKDLDGVELK